MMHTYIVSPLCTVIKLSQAGRYIAFKQSSSDMLAVLFG